MEWLLENFKNYGETIALVENDTSYSYLDLGQKVEEFLELFRSQQIRSGDIVAILGEYSFENIALFLALAKNKNIIVPITTMPQNEIDDRLEEAYVDRVFYRANDRLEIQKLEPKPKHPMIEKLQQKNSSGLILFSSGSTGKPKAMIHNFDTLLDHYKEKRSKNLPMLLFLMFDHIGGLNSLLNILSMGATGVIPPNREVEMICSLIEQHKIKVLPASPTFLNMILISNVLKEYDLSSLRMITYGTEAMPENLLKRLKEAFSKVKFLQTFGTSETGIASTSSRSSDSTYMKIDDKDLEYKIVDGELWLKSKTQILGYLNASMESFEDGWFKTGDLVEEIEDGYLKITGRNKEIINVGGQKVLPSEVESAILELAEFSDVLVSGEKNAITGQSVVAKVTCENLSDKEAKKLIRNHLKTKLENYKIPIKVEVVESLGISSRFKKVRM